MAYQLGESSAAELVRVGLSRRQVVQTLERELGLTDRQAADAWLHVTLREGEVHNIRAVVRRLAHI
jgi:16S rRNA U516 pseudouridylate synthase RsuA-like enzyme